MTAFDDMTDPEYCLRRANCFDRSFAVKALVENRLIQYCIQCFHFVFSCSGTKSRNMGETVQIHLAQPFLYPARGVYIRHLCQVPDIMKPLHTPPHTHPHRSEVGVVCPEIGEHFRMNQKHRAKASRDNEESYIHRIGAE